MPDSLADLLERRLPGASLVTADGVHLVTVSDGQAKGQLSLNKVALPDGNEWWVLSDLDDHVRERHSGHAAVQADHVMGVGGATHSLIRAIRPKPVASAFDLGTGNGIVALYLSTFAQHVVATDVSERAIEIARMNAKLNGVHHIDFRVGSLFAPVSDEAFDLIVSNPPFVIAPPTSAGETLRYRTSREAGDTLLQSIVARAPFHLREGGIFLSLANWEQRRAEVAWIEQGAPAGTSAWLIERGRQSPAEYAAMWLRDGGVREGAEGYLDQFNQWVEYLTSREVDRVSFGYVQVRKPVSVHSEGWFRSEHIAGELGAEELFGDAWAAAFDQAIAAHRLPDAMLLEKRLLVHPKVEEVRVLRPGTDEIRRISLTRHSGIQREIMVGTLEAALVGACDGELNLGEISDALASLLDEESAALRPQVARIARECLANGILTFDVSGYT